MAKSPTLIMCVCSDCLKSLEKLSSSTATEVIWACYQTMRFLRAQILDGGAMTVKYVSVEDVTEELYISGPKPDPLEIPHQAPAYKGWRGL